jgi:hypothetical protein
VSFAVATRRDLEGVARRVGELGYGHTAVIDTARAALLVLRDPDNIQVEVCFWKSPAPN